VRLVEFVPEGDEVFLAVGLEEIEQVGGGGHRGRSQNTEVRRQEVTARPLQQKAGPGGAGMVTS
jgi:hypothetical protein